MIPSYMHNFNFIATGKCPQISNTAKHRRYTFFKHIEQLRIIFWVKSNAHAFNYVCNFFLHRIHKRRTRDGRNGAVGFIAGAEAVFSLAE